MGGYNWNPQDWSSHKKTAATKTQSQSFSQNSIHADLDPKLIARRESRDSDANPHSTPIIIGLDETGSMGIHAVNLQKEGLGVLVEEILKRKPVSDPHIMFMGIGDVHSDSAPLQVTQFEADIRIVQELKKLYLEGNGGGNGSESYELAWYFAALRTSVDSVEQRNKKGYLFTIGDEHPAKVIKAQHIKKFLGNHEESVKDYTSQQLLDMASQQYHVYHIVVEEGHYAQSNLNSVLNSWRELLGERTLRLKKGSKLSEVITSAIEINEGADIETVINSWSGDTALVVRHAVSQLSNKGAGTDVVKF